MKTPAQSISQDSCEENEIPEVALGPGLLTQSAFSGEGGRGGGGAGLFTAAYQDCGRVRMGLGAFTRGALQASWNEGEDIPLKQRRT